MKPSQVVGRIGPELPPEMRTAAAVCEMLTDAFEAGYAACVRDCESGHTMGQLGDWLSEYEAKHAPKVTP